MDPEKKKEIRRLLDQPIIDQSIIDQAEKNEIRRKFQSEISSQMYQQYVNADIPPMVETRFVPTEFPSADAGRPAVDFLVIAKGMGNGEVIAWKDGPFTYAAIKARGRWYTTATEGNNHVEQVLEDNELANILANANEVGWAQYWKGLP